MTDSFDTAAPDPDDRPHHAAAPAALVPQPMPTGPRMAPRRSRFGRFVRWWLGLSLVLLAACVACALIGWNQVDLSPVHIYIDGDDVSNGLSIQGLSDGGKMLLAIGGAMFAMLVVLLVPLFVMLLLAVVLVAIVAGIGLPLVGLAAALVVVTSPLWLIAMIVWLIARDRRPMPRVAH